MAVNTVPSPSVVARAACLLEARSTWATIRHQGMRRVVIPSDSGSVYYVDPQGRACSCKAGQRGLYCSHRLAVTEAANHDALAAFLASPPSVEPAPAPKPRKSYGDIFRACTVDGCDEDAGRSGYCLEHARCWTCRQPSVPGLDHPACDAHRLYEVF